MKKIYENILAVNFGGIGDEILFSPTLISLKKQFPNSKITVALEPRSKGIKDLCDCIDDMIFVDIKFKNKYVELLKFIFNVRFRKFDLVIAAGGNKFISIILFLTGIKHRVGYDTGALSKKLLTNAVLLNKNQYAVEMYHDLVTPLTNIRTHLPQIKIQNMQKEPNTVLIHPGVSKLSVSMGMIKTVSATVWAETIDLLLENGKKVVLTGGPDDKECVDIINKNLKQKNNPNFVDYFGKTKSLADLAALISKHEKFICSDSAPLHVAVGVGTKTYVIFGPTDYKKLIPQSDNIIPILANDSCGEKPCLWARRQKTCEKLDCLKISSQDIFNLVK